MKSNRKRRDPTKPKGPMLRVLEKYDGNGRLVRRAKPILQRIKYFHPGRTRVTTITGDVWDVRKTDKGYVAI